MEKQHTLAAMRRSSFIEGVQPFTNNAKFLARTTAVEFCALAQANESPVVAVHFRQLLTIKSVIHFFLF
jgi:hypothetical protein